MVSDQNKKTLIRTLEEYGRLHFNDFYRKVESKMARQTFDTALKELVELKNVEKESVFQLGGKMKYSYYALPKIKEFELSEVPSWNVCLNLFPGLGLILSLHPFLSSMSCSVHLRPFILPK